MISYMDGMGLKTTSISAMTNIIELGWLPKKTDPRDIQESKVG